MSVDLAAAAQHIRVLTGSGLSPFTAQLFDDSGAHDGHRARILHGTLADLTGALVAANQDGCGVFITVNETDLRGRKAENVIRIRALFVEFDGTMPTEFHLPPSLVVRSRAGLHCYWIVTDCPLTAFSDAQKRLIRHYGSDACVHDLPRVLRLAGFEHRKAEPFLIELLSAPGHRYRLAQILTGIAPLPVAKPPARWQPPRNGPVRGWRGVDALRAFVDSGMYGRALGDGKHAVICPWESDHTRPDWTGCSGGTVIWEPQCSASNVAIFHCSHAHCQGRYMAAALAAIGATT